METGGLKVGVDRGLLLAVEVDPVLQHLAEGLVALAEVPDRAILQKGVDVKFFGDFDHFLAK
jgi:hypothetical protein